MHFSVKKIIILSFFLFLLIILGGLYVESRQTVKSVSKLYKGVLNNQIDQFTENYSSFKSHFIFWKKVAKSVNVLTLKKFDKKLKISEYLEFSDKFISHLPEILGKDGTKVYYVLLQNSMELRPTGGFLGSYAKVKFKNGGMSDILIQDIYVPDGQIQGHVDPPQPIQQAFKQGWFRLRDANFDPDFPKSARTVAWFFEKGGEEKADGVFAINLILAKDLLKIIGPLELVDFKLRIDANNFDQILQDYSEANFFPGSTQKADIMSTLGKTFLSEIKNLSSQDLLKTAKVIFGNLNEKQILVYFTSDTIMGTFHQIGWDGALKQINSQDYLYLVETNLGANKANCCVERILRQEVDFSNDSLIKEKVIVRYKNTGFSVGNYVNYLRFYIPISAVNITAKIDNEKVAENLFFYDEKPDLGIKGVGFFVAIPSSSEKSVQIMYEIPNFSKLSRYSLIVQKEPGIEYLPYTLDLSGKNIQNYHFEKNISTDEEIIVNLLYN